MKDGTVRKWSRERNDWVTLPIDSMLDDPALVRPVPIRALLDAAAADDAVVEALDSKGNPKLKQIRAEEREAGIGQGLEKGLEKGLEQGLEAAIASVCELLDLPFGADERAQLEPLDSTAMATLLERLKAERRWPAR